MSTTTAQELKVYIDESKTGAGNPLLDASGKPLECLKLTAGNVKQLAVFFAGTPLIKGGELPLKKLPEGSELQIVLKATRQSTAALTAANAAVFDQTRTCYTTLLPLNTQQIKDLFATGRRVLSVYLVFSIVDNFTQKSFYVPAELQNAEFVTADKMAGNYALEAAQSASESAASATKAAQSAEQAKTLADEAKSSKEASEKAKADAESAQEQAGKSKESAEQSATEAGNSKNDAEQAKKTAQSASESAERSAQEAQSAKEAAEKAKTDAEAANDAAVEAANAAGRSAKNASETLAEAVRTIEDSLDQAKEDLSEAKNEAIKECEQVLGNVYTKDQVYTKSQLDGVDTGAEVVLKMNEIISQLKDYEAVTGETLPPEFWVEVVAEFQRWQANPNEVKEWVNTGNANENITSTCPYFDVAPTKPVVDFSVVEAKSRSTNGIKPLFGVECYETIFLPATKSLDVFVYSNQKADCDIIAPNATSVFRAVQNAQKFDGRVYCPKATNWNNFAQGAALFNHPVTSQNATSLYMAFYGAKEYNQFTDLRSASNARFAFTNTAMSAENISKTLDSLPTWTDGAEHIITFTGSPGASELTQDSPSVAAAIAKGWTVEL